MLIRKGEAVRRIGISSLAFQQFNEKFTFLHVKDERFLQETAKGNIYQKSCRHNEPGKKSQNVPNGHSPHLCSKVAITIHVSTSTLIHKVKTKNRARPILERVFSQTLFFCKANGRVHAKQFSKLSRRSSEAVE